MKVAIAVQRYLPAQLTGSEMIVRYTAEELAQRGHEIQILTSNALNGLATHNPIKGKFSNKSTDMINGVAVHRFKIRHFFRLFPLNTIGLRTQLASRTDIEKKSESLGIELRTGRGPLDLIKTVYVGPYIPSVRAHISATDYDVVHVTPFPLSHAWLAGNAALKAGIPLVCTPSILPVPWFAAIYNGYFHSLLLSASKIIAFQGAEKQMLCKLGISANKIDVVPVSINPSEWADASGSRFRAKAGIGDRPMVLFAGQKLYDKGATHVLRAMRIVRKKFPNTVLVAMGATSPQWQSEKARSAVDVLDYEYLDGRDKRDVFDACDVFVMPSRTDSFGIVYLEAWMRAKPVIACCTSFQKEFIEDGKNGLLVSFGDVEEIANKICLILEDRQLGQRIGALGRQEVVSRFSLARTVPLIEEIYSSIIRK